MQIKFYKKWVQYKNRDRRRPIDGNARPTFSYSRGHETSRKHGNSHSPDGSYYNTPSVYDRKVKKNCHNLDSESIALSVSLYRYPYHTFHTLRPLPVSTRPAELARLFPSHLDFLQNRRKNPIPTYIPRHHRWLIISFMLWEIFSSKTQTRSCSHKHNRQTFCNIADLV
mgnify:FL=1